MTTHRRKQDHPRGRGGPDFINLTYSYFSHERTGYSDKLCPVCVVWLWSVKGTPGYAGRSLSIPGADCYKQGYLLVEREDYDPKEWRCKRCDCSLVRTLEPLPQ